MKCGVGKQGLVMKQHPYNALNALKVNKLKEPGSYADGNGLYLKVDKSGAKRWIQRITIQGKRRDAGLGSLRDTSLSEARDKAIENRKIARAGGDPIAEKRKSLAVMTFEQAAYKVYEMHLPTWSNNKHAQQWIRTLQKYVFPQFGRKKINAVDSADILHALSPIWSSHHETASRVKQRIGAVMNWAIAKGWRTDNPVASITSALPKIAKRTEHHKSLPFQEVSSAISCITNSRASTSTKHAFELLILTALRSSEVRLAKWKEIDLDNKVWIVPAERMKKRKEHKVPLSPRALEILQEAQTLRPQLTNYDNDYIFPSPRGKALSDATFSKLLKDLEINCVPHGFRSSFRMWAGEKTNIPREVCEFALAHVVGNEAERAYQRSDLFEKRRNLMEKWERYIDSDTSNIIHLTSSTSNN